MIEASTTAGTIPPVVLDGKSAPAPPPEEALPASGRSVRIQGFPGPGLKKRPAGKTLLLLAAACLLASCISIPRPASDDNVCYAPSMGGYDYFWYFSTADPFLPLKSKRAEIIRLERFRKWLTRNGYESPAVEVVSRRVERSEKTLGMTVYEIKYLMKVKRSTGEEEKSKETGTAEKVDRPAGEGGAPE